jgi:hypothetical protein
MDSCLHRCRASLRPPLFRASDASGYTQLQSPENCLCPLWGHQKIRRPSHQVQKSPATQLDRQTSRLPKTWRPLLPGWRMLLRRGSRGRLFRHVTARTDGGRDQHHHRKAQCRSCKCHRISPFPHHAQHTHSSMPATSSLRTSRATTSLPPKSSATKSSTTAAESASAKSAGAHASPTAIAFSARRPPTRSAGLSVHAAKRIRTPTRTSVIRPGRTPGAVRAKVLRALLIHIHRVSADVSVVGVAVMVSAVVILAMPSRIPTPPRSHATRSSSCYSPNDLRIRWLNHDHLR